MKIVVGKEYKVEIEDCCVVGEFTSKLVKAQMYDDDNNPYPASEDEYGTELFFENGVRLEKMGGVTLIEVESK